MRSITVHTMTSVLGLALAGLAPVAAQAQDTATESAPRVESEIIVTAQRREERSVDVPISITAISPETISNANVEQLGDIARVTPSLRFDAAGSFFQPTIRGVGTAITTSGGGPNVGIYVDGFFQSNPEVADFTLMNVQSIQVLKGPQGTLFGRNTTGGAILVTTAEPTHDPYVEMKASYARYNAIKLQGYSTFGLTDDIAMDIEGQFSNGDGFVTNIITGNDKAGNYKNWSLRTGIKADISDRVSLLVRYVHSETDDPTPLLNASYVDTTGQAGFFNQVSPAGRAVYQSIGFPDSKGLPLINLALLPPLYPAVLPNLIAAGAFPVGYTGPSHTVTKNEIASQHKISFTNNSDAVYATLKIDTDFADITSYTQYRKDHSLNLQDLDNSAANFFYAHLEIPNETFSQEFLFNSKPGGPLQWTAGLNYFQNKDTYIFGFAGPPFIPFGGSGTMTKSYAAFADVTYEITPQLFITGGARYSHDVVSDAYFNTTFAQTTYKDENGNTVPLPPGTLPQTRIDVPNLKDDRVTPRVVLRYTPTDLSSVYASYTRGYKAGILNVGGASLQPVKPETIDAFEVGFKYDDRTLSVDLASYYYFYNDLQVSSFQSGQAEIRNAAKSEIWGLEGSIRYRVTDGFSVNAGAAYTHARYKKFPNAPYYSYCDPAAPATATNGLYCANGPGGLAQTTVDASGFDMQRTPDFTGNIGASYETPLAEGQLTLSGNLYYSSKLFLDPTQQFPQKAYEVLSLRAQWQDPSEHFTVALFGDNVTNSRYRTVISYNTIGTGVAWSSPTTYGIQVGVKY